MHEGSEAVSSKKRRRIDNHWLTEFMVRLNAGLIQSSWLEKVKLNQIEGSQQICQELWSFIRELPVNIISVKNKLPEGFDSATKLLNQLADDERHFQNLYLKLCQLAGLKPERLQSSLEIPYSADRLIKSMRHNCQNASVIDGVQAVIAAELAATQFARMILMVLPILENYFAHHQATYGQDRIDEGLSWLRLHAKTNTRHALWMRRMLDDLESLEQKHIALTSKNLPPPVDDILTAVFQLWRSLETSEIGHCGNQ